MKVEDPIRPTAPADPPIARGLPTAPGASLRVTVGDLVEAVASVTTDPAERAAVLEHVLRASRSAAP